VSSLAPGKKTSYRGKAGHRNAGGERAEVSSRRGAKKGGIGNNLQVRPNTLVWRRFDEKKEDGGVHSATEKQQRDKKGGTAMRPGEDTKTSTERKGY